ncbi:hypothetical protein NSS79_34140 [Paenibacillus sp. FSL L8-0436]|uniref:hypothetical protein n=1 Tax=Paenibacillus sp. FSL L8-0436 TaxID=2954686 RepID=UPI0031592D91
MTKLQVINCTQASEGKRTLSGVALLYAKLKVNTIEVADDRGLAFYNEDMLRNNMVVREEVIYAGKGKVQTWVSVLHYGEDCAGEWFLHCGELLSPFQTYQIVREIFSLYQSEPDLESFLQIVDAMSVSRLTSADQPTDRATMMHYEVKTELDEILSIIGKEF